MKPQPFVRLATKPQPAIPPQGAVDLYHDPATGTLRMRDYDGGSTPVGGGLGGGVSGDGTGITDPAAWRETLRLADTEIPDALNWQPYTVAKLANGPTPIRVLTVGDSLSSGIKTPPNMMPIGVIGLSRTSGSTGVTDAQGAAVWIAPYHVIAAGGTAIYHQGTQGSATVVPVRANTRSVIYIAEPGAGSFDISTSTNGGSSWSAATTINAANASQIAVASIAALSTSNNPRYLMRINNVVGGPVKVLAAGLYQSDGIGCIEMRALANLDGLDLFNFGAVPDAIFAPAWTALAPDLIVSNFADAPEDWDEVKLALSNVVTNGTTTITFAAYPATEYAGGQTYRPFPRVGDYITGPNIPAGTRIASHTQNSTTATLTQSATGSGTGTANIRGAWVAFYDRCKAIKNNTDFIQLSMNPMMATALAGHGRWGSGNSYVVGDRVVMYSATGSAAGESEKVYVCTSNHTAGASTKPESGGSWATAWAADLLDPASIIAGKARAQKQALAQRNWALRANETFINGVGMFRDYGAACAVGLMATPDMIHPTAAGHAYKHFMLWARIPLSQIFMGSMGSFMLNDSRQTSHVFGFTTNANPNSGSQNALAEFFRPLRISGPFAQLNLGDRNVPEAISVDVAFQNIAGELLVGDRAIAGISSYSGWHPQSNGRMLGGRASNWWNIGGAGIRLEYTEVNSNYSIVAADYTINVTANSPTITLPAAVALNATPTTFTNAQPGAEGKIYVIKNSGAGTVTVATTSVQTIDGLPPSTLAAGASIKVQSTGAGWITIP